MISVTGVVMMSLTRPKPAGDRNLGKGKWYSGGSDGAAAGDQTDNRKKKQLYQINVLAGKATLYVLDQNFALYGII